MKVAQTESVAGSSVYADRRNEFAKRLKKDSMQNVQVEKFVGSNLKPNTYRGLKIGQYRVVGNGWFLIPRQWYLTVVTVVVTVGPALFQLLYVHKQYRDIKREQVANIDIAKD